MCVQSFSRCLAADLGRVESMQTTRIMNTSRTKNMWYVWKGLVPMFHKIPNSCVDLFPLNLLSHSLSVCLSLSVSLALFLSTYPINKQHMNSTKWQTLTDFVQYLGKTGKCVVAETDRGFDIQVHPRSTVLTRTTEIIDSMASFTNQLISFLL